MRRQRRRPQHPRPIGGRNRLRQLRPAFESLERRSLLAGDLFEPNDSSATATPLGGYGPPTSQIFQDSLSITTGDQDWFQFNTSATGGAGNFVLLRSSPVTPGAANSGVLDLELYDASVKLLATSSAQASSQYVSLAGLPAGSYYLRVVGDPGSSGGAAATNPYYELKINRPGGAGDAYEPNDSLGTATPLFGTVGGTTYQSDPSIDSATDQDWYKITDTGVPLNLSAYNDATAGAGLLRLDLYDGSGNPLQSVSQSSPTDRLNIPIGATAGTFYARVTGIGGALSADYRISAQYQPPDALEPNNTAATATDLGTPAAQVYEYALSITPGDEDWFRFTTTSAGVAGDYALAEFSVGDPASTNSGILDMELYDNSKSPPALLASSTGITGGQLISLAGLPAGTYSLRVLGDRGATGAFYSLKLNPPGGPGDRFEPNDSLAHATLLPASGFPYNLAGPSIDSSTDVDWYQFSVRGPASEEQGLTLSNGPGLGVGTGRLRLDLYDANGNFLSGVSQYQAGLPVSIPLNFLTAGIYYARVTGVDGETSVDYRVALADTGPSLYGQYSATFPPDYYDTNGLSNNTRATATPLGTVRGQSLSLYLTIPQGDEDWYQFTTVAAGGPNDGVRIEYTSAYGALGLELYDASGSSVPLAAWSGAPADVESVSLSSLPAGTYFVHVFGPGGGSNLGQYSLRVDAPGAVGDTYEPNNSLNTASELGLTLPGTTVKGLSISTSTDEDWFRFETAADSLGSYNNVQVLPQYNFSNPDELFHQGRLRAELYDAAGNLLASTQGGYGQGLTLSLGLQPAGAYYVRVLGVDGETMSNYQLLFSTPSPLNADRFEPNDTSAAAYDLGTVSGRRVEPYLGVGEKSSSGATIDPADWYRFTLGAAGNAASDARLDFTGSLGELDLALFAADGITQLNSAAGSGNSAVVSLAGLAAGTYYLRVVGDNGAGNPNYTLTIDAPGTASDPYEPNDTPAAAFNFGQIAGTQVLRNLSISTSSDVDWFTFQTVGPGQAGTDVVQIDYVYAQADLNLELYDAKLNFLGESVSHGGSDAVSLGGLPAGTYYARVYAVGGAVDPGSYRLTITSLGLPPDRLEPNNSLNAPTRLGAINGQVVEQGLNIGGSADQDWFQFSTTAPAVAGQFAQIDFDGTSGTLELDLYDGRGKPLSSAVGTSGSARVSLAGLASGTYYLSVHSTSAGLAQVGYSLTIAAPGPGDRYEPNDTLGQATDLGTVTGQQSQGSLSISSPTDVDWFKFKIPAGAVPGHSVRIDFLNAQGNLDLQLYDGSGNLLATSQGSDDSESISLAGRPGGTYYARVYGQPNPSYTLTINAPGAPPDRFEPNDTAATARDLALVEGRRVEGNLSINGPGDKDWFRFTITDTGSAFDFASIDFSNAFGDLDLLLFDATGSTTLAASTTSADHEQVSLAGLPAGSYLLEVLGNAGAYNTGTYTLRINAPGFAPDKLEPNDKPLTATELGPLQGLQSWSDLSAPGYASALNALPSGDIDYYHFETTAPGIEGQYVRIDFNAAQGGLELLLYSPTGLLSSTAPGSSEEISLAGQPAGTYTIEVAPTAFAGEHAVFNDYSTGTYTLTIDAPAAGGDHFEPNNTLGTATDLRVVQGQHVEDGLSIDNPGDVDWFAFRTTAPGLLGHSARIDFNRPDGNLDFGLYDANGNLIAAATADSGGESVSLQGLPAAAYYLRVSGHEGDTNAQYRLTIDAPGALPDRFEPNDSQANAADLRTVVGQLVEPNLTIDRPADVDWFRFVTTADGAGNQGVRIDYYQAQGDLSLTLLDADGKPVDSSSGPSDSQEVSLAGRPAGTYYVEVAGLNGAAGLSYTLTVNAPGPVRDRLEPNDSATQASFLGLVEGQHVEDGLSIDSASDADWFTFDTSGLGQNGHSVRIDFQAGQGLLSLDLFDRFGNPLRSSAAPGSSQQVSLAGLAAGTYFVRVGGVGGVINPLYSLTIDAPGQPADRFEPTAVAEGLVDFGQAAAQGKSSIDLGTISGTRLLGGLTIKGPDPIGAPDVDIYRFVTVGTGGALDAVRMTFDPALGALTMQLFDQDFNLLATSDASGVIPLTGLPAGAYHLEVSGVAGATNGYSLRFDAPSPAANDWTIMVYATASNLDQSIFANINQMEVAASRLPGTVHIAVLYDQSSAPGRTQYATGEDPNHPWGDTAEAIIEPDADPQSIATPFTHIGEQNTGDPQTLFNFVQWATAVVPAQHYALILADHGNGIQGFNADNYDGPTSSPVTDPGTTMTPAGLDSALAKLATQDNVHLDVLGFDSCLMAMAEVEYQLRGDAKEIVASEDEEPAGGFDYTTAFSTLESNPASASASVVATGLVRSYQDEYQGSPSSPDTLSATSASGMDALAAALSGFSAAVLAVPDAAKPALSLSLNAARLASTDYGVRRQGYRDLGQFLDAVGADTTVPATVSAAAAAARRALASLLVAQSSDRRQSSGMSIYLPGAGTGEDAFRSQYLTTYSGFLQATGWQAVLDVVGMTPANAPAIVSAGVNSNRAISDPNEYPPNNDFSEATPLHLVSGQATISGAQVYPGNDVDYYSFTLGADGATGNSVTVSVPPPGQRLVQYGLLKVTLYDAGHIDQADATQQSSDNPVVLSLAGRKQGSYFLKVESSNQTPVDSYQIQFNAPVVANLSATQDPSSQHAQPASAEDLGTVSQSYIQYDQILLANTSSWFSFATPKIQATASGGVNEQGEVDVLSAPGNSINVTLYDAASYFSSSNPTPLPGGQVVSKTATQWKVSVPYTISGSGNGFLVQVTPAGSAGSSQYSLQIVGNQPEQTGQDTTAPTLTLPPNQSFSATAPAANMVNYQGATATDNVTAAPKITYYVGGKPIQDPAPFPLGTTTVNVSAVDDAGNATTGSFTVTVIDTTPPALLLPPDQTFQAMTASGALVTFVGATATDNVTANPTISYSLAGAPIADPWTFAPGTYLIGVSAVDAAGNAITGVFQITVVNSTIPPAPAVSATIDNHDSGYSQAGAWTSTTTFAGYLGGFGGDYNFVPPSGSATITASATWSDVGLAPGNYDVEVSWVAATNRASNAAYQIYDGPALLAIVPVNQQNAPAGPVSGGVAFQSLGTYTVKSGTLSVELGNNANGYVIADAVRIAAPTTVPVIADNGGAGYSETGMWNQATGVIADGGNFDYALGSGSATATATASWLAPSLAPGYYDVQVTWNAWNNRATSAPYSIYDGGTLLAQVSVNQQQKPSGPIIGGVGFQSLGVYHFSGAPVRVVLSNAAAGYVIADAVRIAPPLALPVVAENDGIDYTQTGPWVRASGVLGYGGDYEYAAPSGSGAPAAATWALPGLAPGYYDVQVTWGAGTNRATNAAYQIYDGAALLATVQVNQQNAPAGPAFGGVAFQSLGAYRLSGTGPLRVVLGNNANGFVVADAVRVASSAAPIVDNGGAGYSEAGAWSQAAGFGGYQNSYDYAAPGDGTVTASWGVPGLVPGTYDVQVTWGAGTNRATNAPYSIYDGSTLLATVPLNQQLAPVGVSSGGVVFQSLGAFPIASGTLRVLLGNNANGYLIADAIRVAPAPALPTVTDDGSSGFTEAGPWAHAPGYGGYGNSYDFAAPGSGSSTATWVVPGLVPGTYDVQVTWAPGTNRATNAPYSIYDGNTLLGTVAVNQQLLPWGSTAGGVVFQSLGTYPLTDSGPLRVVLGNTATGYVIADAVRIAASTYSDNGGPGYLETGPWTPATGVVGFNGNYDFAAPGDGTTTASWTLTALPPGIYDVQVTWGAGTNRASNAPYLIFDGSTQLNTVLVNQQSAPNGAVAGGVPFQSLGLYRISTGTLRVVLNNNANGYVIADAVRIVVPTSVPTVTDNGGPGYLEAGQWGQATGVPAYGGNFDYAAPGDGTTAASWILPSLAAGYYDVQVTWNAGANRASNAPYSIYDGNTLLATLAVDQQLAPAGAVIGGVAFQSLGVYPVASGILRVVLGNNANGYVIADAVRTAPITAVPIVTDDGTSGFTEAGPWVHAPGYGGYGNSYDFAAPGSGSSSAAWVVPDLTPGYYDVQVTWGAGTNRATNAPYSIYEGNTLLATVTVNQQLPPSGPTAGRVVFQSLGVYKLSGTAPLRVVLTCAANGYVIADALRVAARAELPAILDNGTSGYWLVGNWSSTVALGGFNNTYDSAAAGDGTTTASWVMGGLVPGAYDVEVTWTAGPDRATSAAYQIYDGGTLLAIVSLNQQLAPVGTVAGGTSFQSLGHYNVGSGTIRVVLSNKANGTVVADALRVAALPSPVAVDNRNGGYWQAGPWSSTTAIAGYVAGYGGDYNFAAPSGSASSTATAAWQVSGLDVGYYDAEVTWVAGTNRATNAPYQIYDGNTLLATVAVNQQLSPSGPSAGGVIFQSLGVFPVTTGLLRVVLGNNANGYVIADAFRAAPAAPVPFIVGNGAPGFADAGQWSSVNGFGYNGTIAYAAPAAGPGNGPPTATATWGVTGLVSNSYDVQVTWVPGTNRATNAQYQIYDGGTLLATVVVNQQLPPSGPTVGGVSFQSLGVFSIKSGALRVVLGNNANGYVIADAIRLASASAH